MPEKIRIYTNESVNVAITEGLKRHGIKSWSARDINNIGLTDEEQLKYAFSNKVVIFTHDDDFLKMVSKSEVNHYGIIFAHQQKYSVGECIRRIKSLCELKSLKEIENQIEFL